jgi:UDP-3-O-[3-hydroxymyristoyl] glucosamine N-acyltransferase
VIISPAQAEKFAGNKLLTDDPYLCYARVSHYFKSQYAAEDGIAKLAIVHPTVKLGKDVSIGPNTIIEKNVTLADGVTIGANCSIGQGTAIGQGSRIHNLVTIAHEVSIGKRVTIFTGAVIGTDGFGFARSKGVYHKIAQLGSVKIGDEVEIGANTCIDRGALDDTVIGNGVKIDNQVQIAHNVQVGDNTVICGCSAVAGSTTIGRNCVIAGGVGIINHIEIVDNVTVTAMSLVNKSIMKAGSYSSGTGLSETPEWKKNIVRFRQLDSMAKTLKKYFGK